MIPAPDRLFACAACGKTARVEQLRSGNTIGATFWSDGDVDAPMLPEYPRVSRCQACGKFTWISDAPDANDPDASLVSPLQEEDFLDALDAGLGSNRDRELELRISAWRRGNDQQRSTGVCGRRTARSEANIERLYEMLDPYVEWCTKAEVARQLGRFDLARDVLSLASVHPAEESHHAILMEHIDGRDSRLFELPVADEGHLVRGACPECGRRFLARIECPPSSGEPNTDEVGELSLHANLIGKCICGRVFLTRSAPIVEKPWQARVAKAGCLVGIILLFNAPLAVVMFLIGYLSAAVMAGVAFLLGVGCLILSVHAVSTDYPELGMANPEEILDLLGEPIDERVLRYSAWRSGCIEQLAGRVGDPADVAALRNLVGEPEGPDRLLAAELARQDGDFERALSLVETSQPLWDLHGVAEGIRELAVKRERKLGVWNSKDSKWSSAASQPSTT
jgi:hypothetical protein